MTRHGAIAGNRGGRGPRPRRLRVLRREHADHPVHPTEFVVDDRSVDHESLVAHGTGEGDHVPACPREYTDGAVGHGTTGPHQYAGSTVGHATAALCPAGHQSAGDGTADHDSADHDHDDQRRRRWNRLLTATTAVRVECPFGSLGREFLRIVRGIVERLADSRQPLRAIGQVDPQRSITTAEHVSRLRHVGDHTDAGRGGGRQPG